MLCNACAASTNSPTSGAYNVNCIPCMARLIAKSRPSKAMQERQIAYLQHHHKGQWPKLWPQIQIQLKPRNNPHAPPQT